MTEFEAFQKQFSQEREKDQVESPILSRYEKKLANWGATKIPAGLEPQHLIMATVGWGGLAMIFGWLAQNSLAWLWGLIVVIILQYLSDLWGRERGLRQEFSLKKWLFYLGYLLDYFFLNALLVASYLIAPEQLGFWYLLLVIAIGMFLLHSLLSLSGKNSLRRPNFLGVGLTELRMVLILGVVIVIYTGTSHFVWSVPVVALGSWGILVYLVYENQRKLWRKDMEERVFEDFSKF
jgi:hypothetical protein